jgi:uncharacterized protein with beta-barrel porin domain
MLSFQARASETHEFSSVRPAVIESFAAQSGTNFALVGAKADRDAEILGVGLEYNASKQLSFFSRYEEIVGARDVDRYVSLGGRYVW